MNAVQINHITKDYGNSRGIFDVSLSVKKERYTVSLALTAQEKQLQSGTCLVF